MLLTEDLLHYVWKFKLFDRTDLRTTAGEPIEILNAGIHNFNSGPDFQNARLKIGDTVWAGNVEIHTSPGDWLKHGHDTDDAYNNVILHVVHQGDHPMVTAAGRVLPALELQGRIPEDLYLRFHELIYGSKRTIPCEGAIGTVSEMTLHNWLTRMTIERLQDKAAAVIRTLEVNRGNWEETFYQHLAANFGFKINALPFELLARSLPQTILAKHKNNALQVEALIFGQAGMLTDDLTEEYPVRLRNEYAFLQKKYDRRPIEQHLWKFMRLRPSNFPTIRLAQFAALTMASSHLFSKVLETSSVAELRKLFSNIVVNDYWEDHYRFGKESKPSSKNLGGSSVDLLLLNTVAVCLFAYGDHLKLNKYVDRALKLLEDLPLEYNNIVNDFKAMGVKANNAFASQAMIQLKNKYCDHKKCLNCGIGNQILNTNRS